MHGLKKILWQIHKKSKQLSLHTATNRTNEQSSKIHPQNQHKRVQIGLQKTRTTSSLQSYWERKKKVHFLLTSCIRTSTVKRSRGNESSSWELDSSNSQASLIILLRHLSFFSHLKCSVLYRIYRSYRSENLVRHIKDVLVEVRLGLTKNWLQMGRWRFQTNFSILSMLTDFSMVKYYKIPISLRKHALIYLIEALSLTFLTPSSHKM